MMIHKILNFIVGMYLQLFGPETMVEQKISQEKTTVTKEEFPRYSEVITSELPINKEDRY